MGFRFFELVGDGWLCFASCHLWAVICWLGLCISSLLWWVVVLGCGMFFLVADAMFCCGCWMIFGGAWVLANFFLMACIPYLYFAFALIWLACFA